MPAVMTAMSTALSAISRWLFGLCQSCAQIVPHGLFTCCGGAAARAL